MHNIFMLRFRKCVYLTQGLLRWLFYSIVLLCITSNLSLCSIFKYNYVLFHHFSTLFYRLFIVCNGGVTGQLVDAAPSIPPVCVVRVDEGERCVRFCRQPCVQGLVGTHMKGLTCSVFLRLGMQWPPVTHMKSKPLFVKCCICFLFMSMVWANYIVTQWLWIAVIIYSHPVLLLWPGESFFPYP
jgi:hypothetical protein